MSNFIYYEKLEDYEEQVRKAKECDEKDKEIERLNKENEELKKIQCTFLGTGCKAEIERLNNIINELEKELFIKKEFYERELTKRPTNDSEYNTQYADSCALAQICVIYDKLQELKRGDKE